MPRITRFAQNPIWVELRMSTEPDGFLPIAWE
jgi:hypothetical protein